MHPNMLDQLRVFEKAVETGSFSATAKELNRTVSAIGYTIAQLEDHLGLQLFDRSGYRPTLTEQGLSLQRDASVILRKVERLEARAADIQGCAAVNFTVLTAPDFPKEPLVTALAAFSESHPHILITLIEESDDQAISMLQNETAHIRLGSVRHEISLIGFDGSQLSSSELKLVAAPEHPLAKRDAAFGFAELDDYRQVILSPHSIDRKSYGLDVHVTEIWSVNRVEFMRDLVCAGVGWGYLLQHSIAEELRSGTLVELNCKDFQDWPLIRFGASWTTKNPPDKNLRCFIDLLQEHCSA